MLDPERETARTLMSVPWLLVGGLITAVALLAAHLIAIVPLLLLTLPRNFAPVFALPLANLPTVVLLPPALAGLYATVREGRDAEGRLGAERTLRTYARGCVRHARDLTVATLVYRAVALVPAVAAFALLLAGDTAVDYWRYAGGWAGPESGIAQLVYAVLGVMVAGAVGRLLVAFYDLPVLFTGVSPRRSWRVALRVARRRPRTLARYGVGRVLLWSPMLLVLGVQSNLLTGERRVPALLGDVAAFAAVTLVVGTGVATVLAAYHVVVYDRAVEPLVREPTPTGSGVDAGPETSAVVDPEAAAAGAGASDRSDGGRSRRAVAAWALAALLVVGAGAGAGAVRLTDARPTTEELRPVGDADDAEAVLENTGAVLSTASYRVRSRSYRVNETTGERQLLLETEYAVDRERRRAIVTSRVRSDEDEWIRASYYGSERTLALDFPGESDQPGRVDFRDTFVGRTAGEWALLYVSGYTFVTQSESGVTTGEGGQFEVVERTDERVVVERTERPDEDPPEDGEQLAVERVRLVVDRDTGRPIRLVENRTFVEYENGSEVGRYRTVQRRTYDGYGSTRVERPDALGEPGPIEWLWDLVYY
jgi:hypothetical protein